MTEHLGILHPGAMGISVAATAQNSGHAVYWATADRSPQTRARAEKHGLIPLPDLAALCERCTVLISVCPPHAAEALAQQVAAQAFRGVYADVNAIAPQRAVRLSEMLGAHGIAFVDGGIIGGPAWTPGSTWLYLAGSAAPRVANCFTAGPLQTEILGELVGQASALKMCYAAYSKGSTALLAAVLAAAEGLAVRAELEKQWERDEAGLAEQAAQRVQRVTAKAWRFAGEMDEIAATFAAVGVPSGFHQAAATLYRRLADFKDQTASPPLPEVLAALRAVEKDD